MALIDDMRRVVRRLRSRGWGALLARHTLHLDAANLKRELGRRLGGIDRGIPGFADFVRRGGRAIEPGSPAMSLLYHALASPNVHPTPDGRPARADAYPTLEELDVVENYIYSLAKPPSLDDESLAIVVFAYQYRPGQQSPHGYHADLAFSRSGLARVGTHRPRYDPATRSFWPVPQRGPGIAALPARYGAFLAALRKERDGDPVLGRRREDAGRIFAFPVRKLFTGSECLPGLDLRVEFREYHRSEKLRRVHTVGRIQLAPGFEVDQPPFVRDSRTTGDLVVLEPHGASVLVVPRSSGALVRYAVQMNNQSGRREIVHFVVPKASDEDPENRFSSSLEIESSDGETRNAPEYVNIRHEVTRADAARPRIRNLNRLPAATFNGMLKNGGYVAAHFVDDTCDGAVSARVQGFPVILEERAAYSLVTAPDFFPLADQVEIAGWTRSLRDAREHFAQGAPDPLSEGRQSVNPALHRPGFPGDPAFSIGDKTVTAIVGTPPRSRRGAAERSPKRFVSFLPDAGSNEFAPGWDVSIAGGDGIKFYAAYGLGSPFPEDAKLCAALNSFWPAVAPDASRTFRYLGPGDPVFTAIPMLDEELGYHPHHSKVLARSVKRSRGWDGEYGPFIETRGRTRWINYADLARSDYVDNALEHGFDIRLLAEVDSPEIIARMNALRLCIAALPPADDVVSSATLWLVTAEKVERWERVPDRASPILKGSGYFFVFASVVGEGQEVREELARLRTRVKRTFACQVNGAHLFIQRDSGPWRPSK